MDRVGSFEQYRDAVAGARAKGYALSNCFFLPAAAQRKILEGTLFFHALDEGLLLLDDRGGFYRCYYYLPPEGGPRGVTLDKPAVIELPFNGALNEGQRLQVRKIEGMGFRLGRESGMMTAAPAQLADARPLASAASACQPACRADAAQILALLNRCFNPLYAFLPSESELCASMDAGRVWAARRGETVDAVLISDYQKQTASILQVAVEASRRGKGLGKALVQTYHDRYRGEAARFQHWVDLHNEPAVRLYRELGYAFSIRKANEYILTQEERQP